MLLQAERRTAIAGGVIGLAGIAVFVGLAVVALLASGGLSSVATVFFDAYILRVLRFTFVQALMSTLLSIVLAMPVARAIARQQHFPGRLWIIRLMGVPMGLPVLIGALGIISIWGRQGMLNTGLSWLGLAQPISIYGLSGILLAHVFFNFPLACRLMLAGLERLPAEYWLLASSLGMRPTSVFRFIEWPVLRALIPGIAGLIFMLCATSFTLVLILGGGPAATTIEVAIYQALRFDFDPGRAISLSLIQIVMTAAVLGLMALSPAPVELGLTSGRTTRRPDGSTWSARLGDGLWVLATLLFLALPLGAVVFYGMKADLLRLVTEAVFLRATTTSMVIAFSAALFCVFWAWLFLRARYAVAQSRTTNPVSLAFSAALSASSSLVLLVPPIVLATGWFIAIRRFADPAPFAPLLVICINMLMALPFVVRVLAPAYEVHQARTQRLSASLGIFGFARWRLIDWPGLRKPVFTALSFAMALSLGDLGAIALFGSDELVTLPWLVYSRLGSYRTNDADGLALILGILCFVLTIAGTAGRHRGGGHERS